MFKCTAVFLILTIIINHLLAIEEPLVTINQGSLKGKVTNTYKGREIYSFTGIPYAKPPLGPLRFEAPQLAESWDGIYDATQPHPICLQIGAFSENREIQGNEDCLYLNVYTPQISKADNKPLPVMFYIHGGAFFEGHANANLHGPEYLLDKDIVLVTANYRLGPFGFFTTGDEYCPGNNGLKDQAFVIKWIKNNIANFGGDPNSITVFGQSAGGVCAHYQMLTPLNKGLIKGVIAQSGTALSIWALAPIQVVGIRSRALAGSVNCTTYKNKEMIACLKTVNAHNIIQNTEIFEEESDVPRLLFKPIIEPDLEGAFLSKDPLDIIKSGEAEQVPVMTGITTNDGSLAVGFVYKNSSIVEKFKNEFREIAPSLLMYSETSMLSRRNKLSKDIREFYFGKKSVDYDTKDEMAKMYTDAIFLEGASISVELHKKYISKPIYYYLFGYEGSASFCNQFKKVVPYDYGVCHCDDLIYLFKSTALYPNYQPTKEDEKVIELMTTLWTNFAIFGNPTPENDSSALVKWEPVESDRENYYSIKTHSNIQLEEGLFTERASFWKKISVDSRRIRIRDEL